MRRLKPSRIVLVLDPGDESKQALKAFRDADVEAWIKLRRASVFKLVRLPAVYYVVNGKPHFIEGLEKIRRFLVRVSAACL